MKFTPIQNKNVLPRVTILPTKTKTTVRTPTSTASFRAVADLISRLDDPLSQATPAYSSLSKEQGVAWSSVFGLPKVGSRGLMKDNAADPQIVSCGEAVSN